MKNEYQVKQFQTILLDIKEMMGGETVLQNKLRDGPGCAYTQTHPVESNYFGLFVWVFLRIEYLHILHHFVSLSECSSFENSILFKLSAHFLYSHSHPYTCPYLQSSFLHITSTSFANLNTIIFHLPCTLTLHIQQCVCTTFLSSFLKPSAFKTHISLPCRLGQQYLWTKDLKKQLNRQVLHQFYFNGLQKFKSYLYFSNSF